MPTYYAPRRHYTPALKLLAGVAAIILIYLRLSSLVDSHFAKSHSAPELGRYGRKSTLSRSHDPILNGTLPTEILHKRALTWDAAIRRGMELDQLMRAPRATVLDPQHANYVRQKTFQYSDLNRFGWRLGEDTVAGLPASVEPRPFRFPDAALRAPIGRSGGPGGIALGTRAQQDAVKVQQWLHKEKTIVPGEPGQPDKIYKSTGAYYRTAFAWAAGVISTFGALPPSETRRGIKGSTATSLVPPPLEHWSDVTYLALLQHAQQDQNFEMNLIIREGISTPETIDIVFRAVQQKPWHKLGPPVWNHRAVFSNIGGRHGAEELHSMRMGYFAILGTPHGEGVARLLIEHKTQFPVSFVRSITVFHHDDFEDHRMRYDPLKSEPTLIFELGDHSSDSEAQENLDSPLVGTSPNWSAVNSDNEAGPTGSGSGDSSSDNGSGSS